jgi:alanine racemase
LLEGRRVGIAGRVTMDMTVLDAGEREPAPGAVATLLGTDGEATLALDDVAATAGTISYEVLTGLTGRVERVYR